jgi:hypothetical protein
MSNALLRQLYATSDPSRGLIDRAAVGAKSAANTAYGSMIRNLSRAGVNAQSPRFAAQMKDWSAGRAAMEAGARNDASEAGSRAAYSNRFSLWNALNANDQAKQSQALSSRENAASRAFQAQQAQASRQASIDDALRRRQWELSDQTAAAKRDAAQMDEMMSALNSYDSSGFAANLTNTASPYQRSQLARTNLAF